MKRIIVLGLLLVTTSFLFAQNIDAIINAKEVERIEKILSADDMQGRKVNTPGIEKAADFIAAEFKKIGLDKWPGNDGYKQEFVMIKPKFISAEATLDNNKIDTKNIIVITSQPELKMDEHAGYMRVRIKKDSNLFKEAAGYVSSGKNMLVMVASSFASSFGRLTEFKRQLFKSDNSVIFILSDAEPAQYKIEAKHEISEQKLANIAGIIPGKSKKNEYVIFSGHYDHLGIGKPVNGDSIYNGANDDAAGATAVIMLAKYFKALGNNERTLVFVAFTAEEVGGFGSQYFSRQFDAKQVTAMFNIEMIGTDSKWGNNSAYITGYEKTDIGKILEKNLRGTTFTFYPDPFPTSNYFTAR
jgi:Zn-dependent M28 family amino/carboxypeptidase